MLFRSEANHGGDVGFRRRNLPALLGKYFLDMLDAMSAQARLLRSGAPAFYVVGNNSTCLHGEKFCIETDRLLWELGERAGYRREELISMELLRSRDIFRVNHGSAESVLCFRKA